MAMTATERSRVLRERRAHGKVVLTVVVGEGELAEIARAGYVGHRRWRLRASIDRKAREAAVRVFLSVGALNHDRLDGTFAGARSWHPFASPAAYETSATIKHCCPNFPLRLS
jgi:hypothetical protein